MPDVQVGQVWEDLWKAAGAVAQVEPSIAQYEVLSVSRNRVTLKCAWDGIQRSIPKANLREPRYRLLRG